MLRAQLGSAEAWASLVHRYDAALLFYLRRLLGRSSDAEDVRQDVWLTVVRRLRLLDEPRAFRTWLYRIARHRGISFLRKRRRELPLDDTQLADPSTVDDEKSDPTFAPEDAAAMFAAFDLLSPDHREALSLRVLGKLSYEEIAEVLGCQLGTVRSRIHYAKVALRKLMLERCPAAPVPPPPNHSPVDHP